MAYIKIALWGGFFCASPFIIYQAWAFISTGLTDAERRGVYFFLPVSFLLFAGGILFAYGVIIPTGIRLLLSFQGVYLEPMISVSRYISFIGMLLLVFGVIFQLPLAMLFLAKTGLITPCQLARGRKTAIVIIFIAAASLTPPDIVSQTAMALPLIILYEIGIMFARLVHKKR